MVGLSIPKDLFKVGIADTLGNAISAGFWFLIAALLSPEQYGEISYYIGIAGLLSYVSLIGTQNVLTVYSAKNLQLHATFYFMSLVTSIACSLAIIILFYRVDTVFLLFAYVINTLAIGDLLGKKLYSSYSKYVLIQKALSFGLGIGFYFLFGVNGILYALALSYAMFGFRIYVGIRESRVDFPLFRSRIRFIANNYFINIIGGFSAQLDKLLTAPLLGFAVLGSYNLALQVVTMMVAFSSIVFKYTLSHDASGNQNLGLKRLSVLVSMCITIGGILLSPLIIPTIFPKYVDVIGAIQIMSVDVFATTIMFVYTSRLLGLEKSGFVIIGFLIALFVMVIGILTLGPIFKVLGIATAFVLSTSSNAIFLVCASRKIR